MAAPTFQITYEDGSTELVKLRPRAQIQYEEETGEPIAALDSGEIRVSKLYLLAWYAAGKPQTFDEWVDSLDAVELPEGDDADEDPTEDTNLPT